MTTREARKILRAKRPELFRKGGPKPKFCLVCNHRSESEICPSCKGLLARAKALEAQTGKAAVCSAATLHRAPCTIPADRIRDGTMYCHVHDPQGKFQTQRHHNIRTRKSLPAAGSDKPHQGMSQPSGIAKTDQTPAKGEPDRVPADPTLKG